MMRDLPLVRVALRHQAIFLPAPDHEQAAASRSELMCFVGDLARLGFGLDEGALRLIPELSNEQLENIVTVLRENANVDLSWAPLVRGWDVPPTETFADYFATFLATHFGVEGTRLACGHLIPEGTFRLERYTGCPFCGTPFEHHSPELLGAGSRLTVLGTWREEDARLALENLLRSPVPLDATQRDSLSLLLAALPLPETSIAIKETAMAVIDALVEAGRELEALGLFETPADVLRYLWFKKTGQLRLVRPAVIIRRKLENQGMQKRGARDRRAAALEAERSALALRYGRRECARVAAWLEALPGELKELAASMHPQRAMWTRFIRALRLPEYARRPDRTRLARLLDLFYRADHPRWLGELERLTLDNDPRALTMLATRPGLFMRRLLPTLVRFGARSVFEHLRQVAERVPLRLFLSLLNHAARCLDPSAQRLVSPLGDRPRLIPGPAYVDRLERAERDALLGALEDFARSEMQRRFARTPNKARTVWIDPALRRMPLPIGERSDNIQELPAPLMGARFPVQGQVVRLFMSWGRGLPAQHLDMDLSAAVIYDDRAERCYFGMKTIPGCQHSGDIQSIPDQVGTAEYIEVDVGRLDELGARHVVFTCNAWTRGELSPDLVVGWMGSEHAMEISATTGVAYDPSCVQQQIRITSTLAKGLAFGVLDVGAREVIWAELVFDGAMVHNLNHDNVKVLLARLEGRLSIGEILGLRAAAQGVRVVEREADADEVFTARWGLDAVGVMRLLDAAS
ncbi:MAG TPA: hypothetical protein PK095_13295 [Myxococcota bacterium]|nr:hypothetical protein [Myxococcota bacterium]